MIDTNLTGRTALVTGASSGIGAATARLLAEHGARVALWARRADRLDELAGKINAAGGQAASFAVDVADPAAVDEGARRVGEAFGAVDLVVANAGVMLPHPIEEGHADEWKSMIDVNVTGLLATVRAFLPQLVEAAADGDRAADLFTVSSIAAHMTFPNYAVYCATKAAVTSLAANLRTELGPKDVRVTNVEPGLVTTELREHVTADGGLRDELYTWFETMNALVPDDIAELIAFTASRPKHVNYRQLVALPTRQA
ncbi:SDR family oxidoreductase [Wenjunlia tyrosinilytica]|uniref:Oxidoreductase n=1 Tax=Wenjunlia tyrosinilytica TaxID=1544741 RepID=A0A917ZSG4_9ACTN|nr:SDR family oxidoreductase [Wenjunlia tyrosinilytica]GGO89638.1 oxidoreductase [Wenjunlia tyrosinilytica]